MAAERWGVGSSRVGVGAAGLRDAGTADGAMGCRAVSWGSKGCAATSRCSAVSLAEHSSTWQSVAEHGSTVRCVLLQHGLRSDPALPFGLIRRQSLAAPTARGLSEEVVTHRQGWVGGQDGPFVPSAADLWW